MRRTTRILFIGLWLGVACGGVAHAQFGDFSDVTETLWGATVYGGGQSDDIRNNYLFGLKGSYRLLELDPLVRISPEVGAEFRKNYLLAKVGGRIDTREILRFSLFGGIGVLRIQDITNASGDDYAVQTSDESTYIFYGAKFRIPSLASTPILGGILEQLPIEGVSLFVAQETSGLSPPDMAVHVAESSVDEWYDTAIHAGVMLGSATGWHKSD